MGLRSQRGTEVPSGDSGQEVVALGGGGVPGDDPGGVVVDLQQLGRVGLPPGHPFQRLVPVAVAAGQPDPGTAVFGGQG